MDEQWHPQPARVLRWAITFALAAGLGLEKVQIRSTRSMAKELGTAICVCGAITMALFKGSRLSNQSLYEPLISGSGRWVLGSVYLVGSCWWWSLCLILQVPICRNYLDPLALSAWMCLFSALESAALTFYIEPDLSGWKIHSALELSWFLFAGIFGFGLTTFLQSWSVAVKGPLFPAMFNPLATVITTILAPALLDEELHVGSLSGALGVVIGPLIVCGVKPRFGTQANSGAQNDFGSVTIAVDPRQRASDSQKPPLD